jgi:hypothetical protein
MFKNNEIMKLFERFIKKVFQKYGGDIITNGDWADCNRCGAIIHKTKFEYMMGGKKGEIPDVCYNFGMVCKNCFQLVEKKSFPNE